MDENLGTLLELHTLALENVLGEDILSDPEAWASHWVPASGNLRPSLVLSDLWRQPLFNSASADSLLKTFRPMLSSLPFMSIPEDLSVLALAEAKPFVTLAILAVASGSRMVQQHSLFNDEFLKALGLKFIIGGEKSLELVQGLLVYCGW